MSVFRFACPHCGQRISGDAGYKGTQITCPACQQTLTVPNPTAKAAIGTAPPPASAPGKTSRLALLSLVCSLGLTAGSIPGIVCGHLARARMRRDPSLTGKWMATTGLAVSYSFLLVTLAFLTVGFFAMGPKQGRQLTAKQMAANTPEVLATRLVDEVKIGDPISQSAHSMTVRLSRSGELMGKKYQEAVSGGSFSFVLKVDPARPMSLYCTYWGNDGIDNGTHPPRHFDLFVNDQFIATQKLDYNDPGHFFAVEYKLPQKLTRGHTQVTVLFQARPRMYAGRLFGCQMLKR